MTDPQREELISKYLEKIISAKSSRAKRIYLYLFTRLMFERSQEQIKRMEYGL
ncbi:MAG: hypothetical protein OEM38_04030 [Gammaproteobacteria bacterium]|nr:hypothetical protein [Gammaproteobacteria bacterium]